MRRPTWIHLCLVSTFTYSFRLYNTHFGFHSRIPLTPTSASSTSPSSVPRGGGRYVELQGNLAHEKTPTPLRPPQDPRHRPTVGSLGGAFSCRHRPTVGSLGGAFSCK